MFHLILDQFIIFGHIQPFMFIVVAIFIEFFGHVQQVHICRCQFLVMFKDFGHIDLVIMIRSFNNPPKDKYRINTS